jgi:hypothetical protein
MKKGNQRNSLTDGATRALNQPIMHSDSILPSISMLRPPLEPYLVIMCHIMTQTSPTETHWLPREVRLLPSQIEQYYMGGVDLDTTCIVFKSGNIALCAWPIKQFERAISQYQEYIKISVDPITFKPTFDAAD